MRCHRGRKIVGFEGGPHLRALECVRGVGPGYVFYRGSAVDVWTRGLCHENFSNGNGNAQRVLEVHVGRNCQTVGGEATPTDSCDAITAR